MPDAFTWEQRLHETEWRVVAELRRMVRTVNDEVVPELRRGGAQALRALAEGMDGLAQRMEEQTPRARSSARTEGTPRP